MRAFYGLIFDGAGERSRKDSQRLLSRVADGLSILSGLQQGGEPREGCDEEELRNIVRDVAAGLCGREVEFGAELPYPPKRGDNAD